MNRPFITREHLKVLIKVLKSSCDEFIAPRREHLTDIVFGDAKTGGGELPDYDGNSVISPRAFLLPQTEPLFEIKSARRSELAPIEDKRTRVFYGVRPCDIKALVLMREFFIEREFADEPYKTKMGRSTFIALACSKRCSAKAFCDEMGAGPVAKSGFDLQMRAVSRGYIIDIGSEKGEKIVGENKRLFKRASPQDEKEAKAVLKDFTKEPEKIDYKKLAKTMANDSVEPSVWDDIGQRCVICSGCVTLCPTCGCFSVVDRISGDRGERLRYCDGCPYAGFTRMAGGSAPFPLHKDHIRRFFEHKLNHDVDRYGTPSCVGCARCIETCPGNISIRKLIREAVK